MILPFLLLFIFYVDIFNIMESEDKVKSLNDAIKISDHNAIYNVSKQLLKQYPEDTDYLNCFILSALKLSKGE